MVDREQLLGFLREDAPYGDLTSDLLIDPFTTCRAVIRVKETGIIAVTANWLSGGGPCSNSRVRPGGCCLRSGPL
jgi:nicotinate-nucleotide pyrophosphorylase